MNLIDRKLLKSIQDGIPIAPEPFKQSAKELGISEDELISRLAGMIKDGAIRRFGRLSGTGPLE